MQLLQVERYPAQLRHMKDKLASIMAAAIHKGYICVQEGLLDLVDAVLPQPYDDYPAAEDNFGHHRIHWPRLIAQHYLDPTLPGDCSLSYEVTSVRSSVTCPTIYSGLLSSMPGDNPPAAT